MGWQPCQPTPLSHVAIIANFGGNTPQGYIIVS